MNGAACNYFILIKSEKGEKKSLKIMEAQIGKILKETDIIRYEDVYGRIK